MKIYLAARFGRQKELQGIRERLKGLGHEVTSRWIDKFYPEPDPNAPSRGKSDAERQLIAIEDLEDIVKAEMVVLFSERPDSGNGKRGGRHVEYGIAYALAKRVVVVGPRENVFHYLPDVAVIPDVERFFEILDVLQRDEFISGRGVK